MNVSELHEFYCIFLVRICLFCILREGENPYNTDTEESFTFRF
jgi:hypothetical protein